MTGMHAGGRPASHDALRPLRATACAAALLLVWLAPLTGHAGDARAGRVKANACVVCHGALGISQVPNVPHLAGQPEMYVAAQLQAYRSGKRVDEVMSVVARGLSDADIADLAAWFATIEVRAETKE